MKTVCSLLVLGILAGATLGAAPSEEYLNEVTEWRANRAERLTSETGWLTVSGFAWLEPGENPFGSDPSILLRMAEAVAPARAGVLVYDAASGSITVRAAEGVEVKLDDAVITEATLDPKAEEPQVVSVGRVTFWIIERGGKYAVRMRDPQAPLRTEFKGIDAYPIDPAYLVTCTLKSESAGWIEVPNILGYTDSSWTPGAVEFALGGETYSLFPTTAGPEDSTLFFVFSDETSGGETYGGGRFVYTDLQPDGTAQLDFNKAYNPPCAFNPYTTCPLPPKGNDLPVAVRAGEKAYAGNRH